MESLESYAKPNMPAQWSTPLAGAWFAAVSRLMNRLIRAETNRRGRRALHELPDYLLRDLGLSRSEIDIAVSKGISRSADG
ncbi:DUF1127 domain-containing protein [Consotaella salsifontis]|uniref:Uncharacterized conserved protein YjiS, DUF1127 family n=1 Tax=Consotaella salsifontis TaxID=1365950 RepID=A0A1T4T1V1_9HYPH|nr:DUF1127 domain-containing protein [Consotaella salsifontis]SKA34392.1 Uncharacterized conserved protein YjiS, DUF1127 family [Consotaella salsifontis]